MASSPPPGREKLIVDAIHGDIRLKPLECRVIDTASFQRLRHLKQLQFGHVTYPGATHTRFAHSVGVLGIMSRITEIARNDLKLDDEQIADIRLAGLLHDIGHYPYSHLMEKVDRVTLTEEILEGGSKTIGGGPRYPKHEEIGASILLGQKDLRDIFEKKRAIRIANLFRRTIAADSQLSKLIHSSLDMDRLDFLLRDARAAGVPFGQIDLNYLLNNIRADPATGAIGVPEKAITAVDHFLLGRFFMYRSVYYHKTTFGLEEACRHLLRRGRDAGKFGIPANGDQVRALVQGPNLGTFTDAFVDRIIEEAATDTEPVIRSLANSIRRRRPPKLLREEQVLESTAKAHQAGVMFRKDCKHHLQRLAARYRLPVGRFLVSETSPLTLEKRGSLMTEADAKSLNEPEKEEIIKVFSGNPPKLESVVDIEHSIAHLCSNHFYQAFRLYLVPDDDTDDEKIQRIRREVGGW